MNIRHRPAAGRVSPLARVSKSDWACVDRGNGEAGRGGSGGQAGGPRCETGDKRWYEAVPATAHTMHTLRHSKPAVVWRLRSRSHEPNAGRALLLLPSTTTKVHGSIHLSAVRVRIRVRVLVGVRVPVVSCMYSRYN